MYINTKYGGKRLTTKAQQWFNTAQHITKELIKEQRWKLEHEKVWFYMDLSFYLPDKRIRDSHNMLKLLIDALQGLVYMNDCTVMPRIQYVSLDRIQPRVELTVTVVKDKSGKKGK